MTGTLDHPRWIMNWEIREQCFWLLRALHKWPGLSLSGIPHQSSTLLLWFCAPGWWSSQNASPGLPLTSGFWLDSAEEWPVGVWRMKERYLGYLFSWFPFSSLSVHSSPHTTRAFRWVLLAAAFICHFPLKVAQSYPRAWVPPYPLLPLKTMPTAL